MLKPMHLVASICLLCVPVAARAGDDTTSAPQSPPAIFHPVAEELGVAVHHPTMDDLRGIRALGFNLVRMDLTWQVTEQVRGVYNFSPYLPTADMVHRAGLRPMYVLDYGNSLYSPTMLVKRYSGQSVRATAPATPAAVEAYGRWAQAATRAFAAYDPIFEIWNEPDVDHWWPPAPDPFAYGRLAAAACRDIRAVDPYAQIIGPGVADLPKRGDPHEYLAQALTVPGLACLDAISVHAYDNPGHLGPDDQNWHLLRRVVDANLPGKRIAVTEWGLPTSHDGSEQSQTGYLVRSLLLALSQGVRTQIWYEYKDEVTGFKNDQDHYGLIRGDGSPKPAGAALKYLISTIGALTVDCSARVSDSFVIQFKNRSGRIAAMVGWKETGTPDRGMFGQNGGGGTILTDATGGRMGRTAGEMPRPGDPVYLLPANQSGLHAVCPLH